MDGTFNLTVNGREQRVVTDPDRPLLDVLREDLALTGAKYGCGEGECGACTVLVDGAAVRSCITTVAEADGRRVLTIEGLARSGGADSGNDSEDAVNLHPVQRAFIEKQAMQCGYCVPGQIMNAVALLNEAGAAATREQIVAGMQGNLCRCCNYANLLAAVEHAAEMWNKEDSR